MKPPSPGSWPRSRDGGGSSSRSSATWPRATSCCDSSIASSRSRRRPCASMTRRSRSTASGSRGGVEPARARPGGRHRAVTAAAIPDLERQIALTENALSVLLGRVCRVPFARESLSTRRRTHRWCRRACPRSFSNAARMWCGRSSCSWPRMPTSERPGALLPDDLAYRPARVVSHESLGPPERDATVWSVSPGIFQPIFQAGRIRRNYEAAISPATSRPSRS